MTFRVGLAQFAPRLGDVRANLDTHLEFIARAREHRVELLIFPELGLTGYYLKDLVPEVAARPTREDPFFGPLLAASRELDLVVSFVEEDARYRFYIAAAYLSGERVVHVHRKVYLPTYRLFDDARFFAPGDGFCAFDTRFGRMGILICEDAWHLAPPYILWHDRADFIIDVSASPGYGLLSDQPGRLANQITVSAFLHAYAEVLTDYIFFVNRVGVEDGISFWGGSAVLGPGGEIVKSAPLFDEVLVAVDVEPDALWRARQRLPLLRDDDIHLTLRELERVSHER
jgi:predicted amidohydrolase